MRRQTSPYERVMLYYSDLGPMYFAFRLRITGSLSEKRLSEALQKIRIEFDPETGERVWERIVGRISSVTP